MEWFFLDARWCVAATDEPHDRVVWCPYVSLYRAELVLPFEPFGRQRVVKLGPSQPSVNPLSRVHFAAAHKVEAIAQDVADLVPDKARVKLFRAWLCWRMAPCSTV